MASVIEWMLGTRTATIQTLGHPAAGVLGWIGANNTPSGVIVNENTLLNYSACWCATRVICEALARLPLPTYERLPNGGKRRATDHHLYSLLHDSPNREQTSMTFREVMTERALNSGTAYAEIERNNAGEVVALHPIHQSRVRRVEGGYAVTTKAGPVALDNGDMFVLTGPLGGKGVIPYGTESVGAAMAAERHGATFFGNNAMPAGLLKHKGSLNDTARTNIRKEWNEIHSGPENAGKIGILWEGMEFQQLSVNNEQAQYLQTRQHNISEIARWYNITPHKLHDLTRATFSNVEHLQISFVTDTVLPWLVRWEQAIHMQLFAPGDRKRYFAEHLIDGLLRGDLATRYNAYAVGLLNGWLTINDVLRFENMNPIGPEGDVHRVPLNQSPVGQEEDERSQVATMLRGLVDGSAQAASEIKAVIHEGCAGIAAKIDGHESASAGRAAEVVRIVAEHEDASSERSTAIGAALAEVDQRAASRAGEALESHGVIARQVQAVDAAVGMVNAEVSKVSAAVEEYERRERGQVEAAALSVLAETMARVLTKEGNAATRAAGKPESWFTWLDEFYGDHAAFVASAVEGPLRVVMLARKDYRDVAAVAKELAAAHCEQSKAELLADADGDREQFATRVAARVESWQSERQSKLGERYVAS